jgi:MFS family permease
MRKRLGPEQWAVIRLALIAVFAEAAYAIINTLALPDYVRRVLQAPVYLGAIVDAFLIAEAAAKGPMGAISDRVGRRTLLMVAPLLSALAAIAITFVHGPLSHGSFNGKLAFLFLIRGLDGIGAAALWPTMFAAVADQVPEERRGSAMSTLTTSYIAGIAVGPAVAGWTSTSFSVRAPFYVVAALFLMTSLAAVFLAPQPAAHAVHPEAEKKGLRDFLESLRAAPQFVVFTLVVFLAIGLLIPTARYLAQDEFLLDAATYGGLFVIPAVIIGVLAVPLGRLGDRWGAPRAVRIGMGTAAAAMWALALLPKGIPLFVLGAAALGLGFVIGFPAWMAIVSGLSDPQHRGAMIGAMATTQGIGAAVGVGVGPPLYVWHTLAERLRPYWPGHSLSSHLFPVLAAAILLTGTWLGSLVVVRDRPRVAT